MNKQEACKLLGVSQRTLENYISRGRLSVKYVKGKTRDVADLDRAELVRLKEELAAVTHRPAVAEQGAQGGALITKTTNRESLGRFAELRELAEVLRPSAPPPMLPSLAIKLLLTVKEAVDYTGAGESVIRAAIDSGKLKASKSGPRGARVVKRSDLEAWVKKL